MKTIVRLVLMMCVLLSAAALLSADQSTVSTGKAEMRLPVTTAPSSVLVSESPATPIASSTVAASPKSGEQIRWQVIGGGGGRSTSTIYALSGTAGQAAAGTVSSTNYRVIQGFWQDFGPPGCCIGTTGNVNRSVSETPDLSDLSLLISYLTQTPRPTLPCVAEANVNASVAPTPDLSDLSLLISYLTQTPRPTLPSCP